MLVGSQVLHARALQRRQQLPLLPRPGQQHPCSHDLQVLSERKLRVWRPLQVNTRPGARGRRPAAAAAGGCHCNELLLICVVCRVTVITVFYGGPRCSFSEWLLVFVWMSSCSVCLRCGNDPKVCSSHSTPIPMIRTCAFVCL